MNDAAKCINGSNILVLGVAYKKNVGDVRESPALEIIEGLQAKGGKVSYADPFVPTLVVRGKTLKSVECNEKTLERADCVIIVANHDSFDYKSIGQYAKLIVDTRNAMKAAGRTRGKVVKL